MLCSNFQQNRLWPEPARVEACDMRRTNQLTINLDRSSRSWFSSFNVHPTSGARYPDTHRDSKVANQTISTPRTGSILCPSQHNIPAKIHAKLKHPHDMAAVCVATFATEPNQPHLSVFVQRLFVSRFMQVVSSRYVKNHTKCNNLPSFCCLFVASGAFHSFKTTACCWNAYQPLGIFTLEARLTSAVLPYLFLGFVPSLGHSSVEIVMQLNPVVFN